MSNADRIKAHKKGFMLERIAALYLQVKGYKILKMRYKTPVGEIDIVARRKNSLVFVEVKGRKKMSEAIGAVTLRNQRRVARAALHFIAAHPQVAGLDIRFDVMAFSPPFSVQHLDNAWRAGS
ncbi:MAG: YraN family protein [Alphaproteobacteria bacterium]